MSGPVTSVQRPVSRFATASRVRLVLVAPQEISIGPEVVECANNWGGNTTKESTLVMSPWGVRMVIGPSVASGGTIAVISKSTLLAGALVNTALVWLKSTAVAPLKLVPDRVTLVLAVPVAGRKLEV